jgi:predicted acyltransferase
LLLAAAILLIDIWRIGRRRNDPATAEPTSHPSIYKPVLVFGTNAILAYMISELGASLMMKIHTQSGASLRDAAYRAIASHVPATTWASLLYSLAFTLICWLLVLPFYRKRIFLRIG